MNTITDVTTLLAALEAIRNGEVVVQTVEDDEGVYVVTDQGGLAESIVRAADELLILEGGSCNWGNIKFLRKSGFNVFAGEQDSFGWLCGVIRIAGVGLLVYG